MTYSPNGWMRPDPWVYARQAAYDSSLREMEWQREQDEKAAKDQENSNG